MTEPSDDDRYATLLEAFFRSPSESALDSTSYRCGLHRLFETFSWVALEHGGAVADAERARIVFDSVWRFLTAQGDRLAEVFNGADAAMLLERYRGELEEVLRARVPHSHLHVIDESLLQDAIFPAEAVLQTKTRLDRLRTRMSDSDSPIRSLGAVALVLGVAAALWWAIRAIRQATHKNDEYREFARRFAGQAWADRLLARPLPREWLLSRVEWHRLSPEERRSAAMAMDGVLGCSLVEPRLGDRVDAGMRVLDEKLRSLPFVLCCSAPGLKRGSRHLFDPQVQPTSAERVALEKTRDNEFTQKYLNQLLGELTPDFRFASNQLRELEDHHTPSQEFDRWLASLIETAPDGALMPVVTSRGGRFIGTDMNSVGFLTRPAEATVERVETRGLRRGANNEVLLKAWVHAKDPDGNPFV